ncbi:MAG: hypothetical protein AB7O62_03020 [Pirellulales bacterium]
MTSALRGKLILLGFLLFAVLSATGGIVYQRSRAALPLEFYGTVPAQRILIAPQVYIMRLEEAAKEDEATGPQPPPENIWTIEGRTYLSAERREITKARGLVNIRYALLDRGTYDWNVASECQPEWAYALEFVEPAGTTRLMLSFECPRATTDGQRTVSIAPSAASLRAFVEEQFEQRPPAAVPPP